MGSGTRSPVLGRGGPVPTEAAAHEAARQGSLAEVKRSDAAVKPGRRFRPAWLEPVAVAAILAFALVYPIAWSNLLPYGRGPDEPDHFDMVDFLLTEHRLPVFGPQGDRWIHRSALGQPVESYAAYPLLTYLCAAPFALLLPIEPFRAARLVSSLSVPLIALCTWLVARRLVPRQPAVYLGAAAVVPLIPQVAFVGAYLNRDAFGSALAAVVLWLSARGAFGGWSWRLTLALGAVLGLVAATNYPAYPVAVVPALLMLFHPGATWPRRLGWGALTALGALLTGGWWFARNLFLYGELMPERILREGLIAAAPDYPVATADRGLDVLTLLTRTRWLLDSFSSFWAVFDQQNLFLRPGFYGALLALCAVAALGCLATALTWSWRRWRGAATASPAARVMASMLVFVALLLLGSIWSSVSRDNSPQGRYLFPGLVPLAIMLVAGWRVAGSALLRFAVWGGDGRLPSAGVPTVLLVLFVGLGYLNLASLRDYVVPAYYGGGADRLRVTVNEPDWGDHLPAGRPALGEGWAIVERALPWQPDFLLRPPRWYAPVDRVAYFADAAPGAGGVELGTASAVDRPDVAHRFGGDVGLLPTGYRLEWDPARLGPGRHRLFVCVWGGPAEDRYCTTLPIVVE